MKKTIFFAVALFTLSAAKSQTTATASQTVSLTLQNSINIAITSATGNAFTFANTTDYQNGLTNTNASSFTVKSNMPWAVTVNSASANFTGPASPAPSMPASVLGVKLNGGSSFSSLSTTSSAVTSGARGTGTFSVDYNANPGFIYNAGTYSISVVYTATQQ